MPTRILHDSFLTSPSLRACSVRAQDAFPRFLLCADDFGCFEAAPRVIMGRAWPYRDDVTEGDVRDWLVEYAAQGMILLWDVTGRWWAHFRNWDRYQRLRTEYHPQANPKGSKRKTPPPPPTGSAVDAFVAALGIFPPGKLQPEDRVDVAEIGSDSEQPNFPGNFPPGKSDFPGKFPRTQSQSQSQVQLPEVLPVVALPARETAPSPITALVRAFDVGFRRLSSGKKPTWGPKQGKMLKDLAAKHSQAEILERMAVFFGAIPGRPPKWPTGHDLGTFVAKFDLWVPNANGTGLRGKTTADRWDEWVAESAANEERGERR